MRISALWILLIAVFGLLLGGCGGNNEGYRGTTPFTGAYAGNFYVVGTGDVGYMTLTIADNAEMAGTFTNAVTGETGRIVGGTHPEGLFNATFITDTTGATVNVSGIMSNSANGTRSVLNGDGTYKKADKITHGFTFDLTRGAGSSDVAGSFGATWQILSPIQNGMMNVTINNQGLVTGQFSNTSTAETGIVKGVVDASNNFTIYYIVDGTGEQITLKGSIIRSGSEALPVWQGTGTYQRPGQDATGYAFTTVTPGP